MIFFVIARKYIVNASCKIKFILKFFSFTFMWYNFLCLLSNSMKKHHHRLKNRKWSFTTGISKLSYSILFQHPFQIVYYSNQPKLNLKFRGVKWLTAGHIAIKKWSQELITYEPTDPEILKNMIYHIKI